MQLYVGGKRKRTNPILHEKYASNGNSSGFKNSLGIG